MENSRFTVAQKATLTAAQTPLLERQRCLLAACIANSSPSEQQQQHKEEEEEPQQAERPKKRSRNEPWRCTCHPHYTRAAGELCLDASLRGAIPHAVQNAKASLRLLEDDQGGDAEAVAQRFGQFLHDAEAERCRVINTVKKRVTEQPDAEVEGSESSTVEALYQVLVSAVSPVLGSEGFTLDAFGFVVCLATLRLILSEGHTNSQRHLEEVLTSRFHGGRGTREDYRFEFVKGSCQRECRIMVVAFSSLGDYLIRPEWTKTLDGLAVDRLHVMDPACSWYMQSPACDWSGFEWYEARLKAWLSGYKIVILLGDSMGGSGALLFSHLATCVIAFVPQVCLSDDIHCRREDFSQSLREEFSATLLRNLDEARHRKDVATILVHRGGAAPDQAHTALLGGTEVGFEQHIEDCSVGLVAPGLTIVVHDCTDHFVSSHMKQAGLLKDYVHGRVGAARRQQASE